MFPDPRPGLRQALAACRRGDTLVVTKLDRLARSVPDARNIVDELTLMDHPDSVAAVFVEPVQNAGGSCPPAPGYFERLREICYTYDVLLVSDEVICAYGWLGTLFGCKKVGYQPDIITSAKGLTSGYAPAGGRDGGDPVTHALRGPPVLGVDLRLGRSRGRRPPGSQRPSARDVGIVGPDSVMSPTTIRRQYYVTIGANTLHQD